MSKFVNFISPILFFSLGIMAFVCFINLIVWRFMNPDMTEIRFFMIYWKHISLTIFLAMGQIFVLAKGVNV